MPRASFRDFAAPCAGIDTTYQKLLRSIVRYSLGHGLQSSVYWKAHRSDSPKPSYDLHHPRIRRLISDFRTAGVEMGVHPSYDTYGSLEKLRMEVSAVRDAIGEDRIGGRQDFLRWNPETWIHWDVLGLAYDATVGYADCVGFRAGTAYPYRPWLLSKAREARLVEIPLMAMESTLLGYMKLSAEEALRTLLECVERCRTVGGVFSLLWHNTRLIGPGYAEVYLSLLGELYGTESYDGRAASDERFWS